jgi:alpha-N-arabinofuranosidase
MNSIQHIPPGKTVYTVRDKALYHIDDRLFGHFMERPSGGEIGIEAAVMPGTNSLQPEVRRLLGELRAPIIRFPAGTDVDSLDWRDMVSNVPGRDAERPLSKGSAGAMVTNRFGYDEFLRLCHELKAEPILVVNFADALLSRKPLKDAALHAASLVAYANAPLGARLPEGMVDWPAVRARNGMAEPYGVRYFQIGNETWAFLEGLREKDANADVHGHYVNCLAAYVEAMRAVDPSIEILADACSQELADRIHQRLGDKISFWVQHNYLPWAISPARSRRDGRPVALEQLAAEDVWKAWVAIPGAFNELGESVTSGTAVAAARKYGQKAAVTEWNWNGWWETANPPFDSLFAKGVGAAGFLHAFIRAGDVISIACQSMTVGCSWDITAIHVDREEILRCLRNWRYRCCKSGPG